MRLKLMLGQHECKWTGSRALFEVRQFDILFSSVMNSCPETAIYNRPIPHKLIGWANYFLLKCWGKNHDVMLPVKHCFSGKSVQHS